MFVITADQVGSRKGSDRVSIALGRLNRRGDLLLPAERTAGDELQLVTQRGATALDILLELSRSGEWNIGCGVGGVSGLDGGSVRSASGAAFVAARAAVERSKAKQTRFALRDATTDVPSLEALIDLLLVVRSRRTAEGWEVVDLLAGGTTQAQAAQELGITPQAVSQRAIAAAWRVERAALPALADQLEAMDRLDVDQSQGAA
ncbi:DNA-binding protein [Ruicaihuangia caeni]|uniref:DNA-binding protein n=1 Tax=Ruicaihuangia caeni TaxID=3042517 RepID=A0AAW6T9H0_9MICO|nr:DNA-binding protein [Klugiella sp. YN-L-19]MDI2099766.1 DNA-binding protein [Klugiella sp. YN-L-19]